MRRLFNFLAALLFSVPRLGEAMAEEVYNVDLLDTVFWGSDIFEMTNRDGSDAREVFLAIFKSPFGAELKSREPTSNEIEEVRGVCRYLRGLAQASAAGEVDDYFVEFASGEGPIEKISPSNRTVFGFERETGCDGPYAIIGVS